MITATPCTDRTPSQRELERLDMTHVMLVKAIGGELFLAPLDRDNVHKVLDIGTGTGSCTSLRKRALAKMMVFLPRGFQGPLTWAICSPEPKCVH